MDSHAIEAEAPVAAPRNPYYDVLRGVAMIFVIFSHMMHQQDYLGYNLLMACFYANPFFFLVSGYLLSAAAGREKFSLFFSKRLKGLVLPYLVFFGVSFLWYNTVLAYFSGAPMFSFMANIDWPGYVKAFFLGGKYLYDTPLVPSPLWFLHTLFFTSLIYFPLAKMRNKFLLALVAAALVVVAPPVQALLGDSPVWLLRQLPVSLFFMLAGHVFRLVHDYLVEQDKAALFADPPSTTLARNVICGLGGLFFIILSLRLVQMGRGDMHTISSRWYFLGGLTFTAAWMLIMRGGRQGLLSFMGQNSLYYLAFNGLVLGLPFVEHIPAALRDRAFDGLSVFVIYFLICFLLITALVVAAVGVKAGFLALLRKFQNG